MSCVDENHSSRCSLCGKFSRREQVKEEDFKAVDESLAIACPYYQLQQGLNSIILDPEPTYLWQEVRWVPTARSTSPYMLEVLPLGFGQYWDVYLEPGSFALPGLDCMPEPGAHHYSPEAFAFVERCRKICRSEHHNCQHSTDERVLPPRLLKVDGHHLVLVETDGLPKDLSYVALSYCWGGGNSLCTTRDTIDAFGQGIDPQTVPAVLQDATEITKKLGEQYIWIDRLCIQQDDEADWQRNASIMARIYEQAELTVAAVTSASVHDSFLHCNNQELRSEKASIAVPWPEHVRERFKGIRTRIRSKSSEVRYDDSMRPSRLAPEEVSPLDSRGWTYQERYLSRRSVRYEAHQIVWECVTAQYLEMFPFDTLQPATQREWQTSVKDFTSRNLTVTGDRSAAISGLALRHARSTKEKYLAGLWGNGSLLSQLLWEPNLQNMLLENSNARFCEAHSLEKAPSWSWTSISLPVKWQMLRYEDTDFSDIKLIETDVKPAGLNPFGGVVSPAKLILRAKLLDATLTCRQQDPSAKTLSAYSCDMQYKSRFHTMNAIPDTHLILTTIDDTSRWERQSKPKSKYLRPGTSASVKVLSIDPTKRIEVDRRTYSLALILGPKHGDRQYSVPRFERIGHMYISDDDDLLREAIQQADTMTFCFV